MEPTSVTELVDAAKQGDENAWNDLVDRYLPLVHAITSSFRLTSAEADDVNQTVWLHLVEHLDTIREPRALPGWLATTTRNECLRTLRIADRSRPFDPQSASPFEEAAAADSVEEPILRAERHQALREALLELPEPRRELLRLLVVDPPLSYAQISARLGIAVGSIGPLRGRAVEQLRNADALRPFVRDAAAEMMR